MNDVLHELDVTPRLSVCLRIPANTILVRTASNRPQLVSHLRFVERFLLGSAASDDQSTIQFFSSTGYGRFGNYCISSMQIAIHYLTDCDLEGDIKIAARKFSVVDVVAVANNTASDGDMEQTARTPHAHLTNTNNMMLRESTEDSRKLLANEPVGTYAISATSGPGRIRTSVHVPLSQTA